MYDLGSAKRHPDSESEGDRMESRKRPKMDCSGFEEDVCCAPGGSSIGDNADNEDSVCKNLEGGDSATDGDDSARKAEFRASVSYAPMEAQVAPATDPDTITKNAVAAAAVEIDMYTAVSTVAAATTSATSANDLGCFDNLSSGPQSQILDKIGPPVESECRPPEPWSAISASIEKDAEHHRQCDRKARSLELDATKFEHLGKSFPTRTVDDYRADMAPHIRPLTHRPHRLSIANEVIITLADDDLDRFTLSFTLVLDRTDSTSPYRPNHEPFVLTLGQDPPENGAMLKYLHDNENRSRLLSCFQILEMAVYSLILDVFTPTLSQESSGYKFRRAMGATNQSKLSPTAPPATLDFEPGMLSKHMFDLWTSGAERHEFICLVYRFQFSRQNANREELTEEFWLDDGTSLTTEDRSNVADWRAFFKISQHFNFPSDVRERLEAVRLCIHTDDIILCPFTPQIDSGETFLTEEAIEIEKDWRDYCAKRPRDAADWKSPSKQTIEAFLSKRGGKMHKTDNERAR